MPISNALIAYLADESAFGFAARDILQVVGGLKDVRLPGDLRPLPDDVTSVRFKKILPSGDRGLVPGAAKLQEYSIFTGVVEVTRGRLRTSNIESSIPGCIRLLDEDIGVIRACFLRSAENFTIGRLANFVVTDIIEQQPVYGVDNTSERERDFVMLPFLVTYERKMANWPA